MDRYEAAIIGAGPEGLVASIVLARAGVRVLVLEKNDEPGGRATTLEFHPGFRASPYADELPPVPHRLYRSLGLAKAGAIMAPSSVSIAVTASGTSVLFEDEERLARSAPAEAVAQIAAFKREHRSARAAIENRAAVITKVAQKRWFGSNNGPNNAPSWPSGTWVSDSLENLLRERIGNPLLRLHLAADAMCGRAVSPFLAGTALHALAPGVGGSGQPPAGLGRLGRALADIAAASGVTIRCNATVTNVSVSQGRATGVVVEGKETIETGGVLSALDLKQTILGLVHWADLPESLPKRAGRFRMAGGRARVLFALDALPDVPFARQRDGARGPIHVADSLEDFSRSYDSWRRGVVPEAPLVTLRVPSLADPRLAPIGKAVMTATLSAIPARLFDGPWTDDRRNGLSQLALAAAERAMPGIAARVIAQHVLVGSDFEVALGATAGDLDGGELAPDQALEFRPFGGPEWQDGRAPVQGLYLGGPSSAASPFLLGASGERAALAMLADFQAGHLR